MNPALLILSAWIAQVPLQNTATATPTATTLTSSATVPAPAAAPEHTPPPEGQATKGANATEAAAPSEAPSPKLSAPSAPPATATAAAKGPALDEKSVLLAWALSFGVGFGAGNWYADAPGQAIFAALGEISGIVLIILGKGGGRAAGLATLVGAWALDWSSAIHSARQYNERLKDQASLSTPTHPEALTTQTLPPGRQLSLILPF